MATTIPMPEITNPTELLAAMKQAMAGVKSYRLDTLSSSVLDDHNVTTLIDSSGIGLVDLERQRLFMDTSFLSTSPQGSLSNRTQTYWVDGWAYRGNIPVYMVSPATINWYKYPFRQSPSTTGRLSWMLCSTLELPPPTQNTTL